MNLKDRVIAVRDIPTFDGQNIPAGITGEVVATDDRDDNWPVLVDFGPQGQVWCTSREVKPFVSPEDLQQFLIDHYQLQPDNPKPARNRIEFPPVPKDHRY